MSYILVVGEGVLLAPIISKENILGLSIYKFPDSEKNTHFGFIFISGEEATNILKKIKIPIPKAK